MDGLVGHTGYVGSELVKQRDFQATFNSRNIADIEGYAFNDLVVAGLPAAKWKANEDPESDLSNMKNLFQSLQKVKAERVTLISTIDVYQPPLGVDEDNKPNIDGSEAYGRHRAIFEKWMSELFENISIVRLPGLFSNRLRKNLIFDLLNQRTDQIEKHSPNSEFQFFNMSNLLTMIDFAKEKNISILNVASEPVRVDEIVSVFGEYELNGDKITKYDFRSKHAPNGLYFYSKSIVLADLLELQNEA